MTIAYSTDLEKDSMVHLFFLSFSPKYILIFFKKIYSADYQEGT